MGIQKVLLTICKGTDRKGAIIAVLEFPRKTSSKWKQFLEDSENVGSTTWEDMDTSSILIIF